MRFSRALFVALALCSCTPLVMPPVMPVSVTIPTELQPTSKPVVLRMAESAPYDGALLTEGQLRLLRAQRDWLQGQVRVSYLTGRQEGEIVLSRARAERPWLVRLWVATGLALGIVLGYGVAEVIR
jgi:hypothetical protein